MKATDSWRLVTLMLALMTVPVIHAAETAVVYKSPTCGCCEKWVEHMRASGFSVKTENVADIMSVKARHGVPAKLASCHTTLVGGYVVEGHVPARDIQRLLKERPNVAGLALPGMPAGSPGMGDSGRDFTVLRFKTDGSTATYSKY